MAGKTTDAVNTSTTTITNNINTVNTNIDNSRKEINKTVNDNRTLIINNANDNTAALTGFSLRLMIEADLASPDNSTPLAIFETPKAKGGYLESVREIVVETIKNLAGASASQANSSLAQGDSYKAAGNYKAAYAAYKKAYKSAAN